MGEGHEENCILKEKQLALLSSFNLCYDTSELANCKNAVRINTNSNFHCGKAK
jgi:hypothetical protein